MVVENLEKFSTHENENKNSEKKKFEEKAIIMHIFHSSSTIIITALLIIALSLSPLLHSFQSFLTEGKNRNKAKRSNKYW